MSELQNDHTNMLAAAEWAAEIFTKYGRKNPDYKDGVDWMTRGMLVFLGLMDVRSEMQVGDARTMTLTECIERGKDLLEHLMEETDG